VPDFCAAAIALRPEAQIVAHWIRANAVCQAPNVPA
jgi:hypothetical protein